MDKFIKLLALLIGMTAIFFAGAAEKVPPQAGKTDELRIVPVERSPDPSNLTLTITFPSNEVVSNIPVYIETRVFGFPLGINTEYPRESEVYNDPQGQSLHIFLDNEPYFPADEPYITALDPSQNYWIQYLNFPIPTDIAPGAHVIRIIPVRSYNESFKGDGTIAASSFYFKSKKGGFTADLSAPYLIYNEPQGEYDFSDKQPILLDFGLANAQLSKDGYKVRLMIDGKSTSERIITDHVPYYVYNLQPGSHTFRLQLLDPDGHQVPGAFNDASRTIQVKK